MVLYIILGSEGGHTVNLNHKKLIFQYFPGPGNFKEKNSRTFKDLPGGMGTLYKAKQCENQRTYPKN